MDGRREEMVKWEEFIAHLKLRIEISLDLDQIFKIAFGWMSFCSMQEFKQIFGNKMTEEIDWETFKNGIQRCGVSFSINKLIKIFKTYSDPNSNGFFLDFN